MPSYQVTTTTATLTASTPYTAIELRTAAAPAIKIVKWWVDFDSSTSTDKPVLVQVARFSAAVTTISAATPLALNYLGNSSSAATAAGVNATSEGAGTPYTAESHYISPLGGLYVGWETDDTALWVGTSAFWRLRITPGSAITSTTANCGVVWVE